MCYGGRAYGSEQDGKGPARHYMKHIPGEYEIGGLKTSGDITGYPQRASDVEMMEGLKTLYK